MRRRLRRAFTLVELLVVIGLIAVLAALVAERGAVVSKNDLLSTVWPGQIVEENNAAVHVSALRRVLGREAIVTVTGQGYRFALPLLEDATLRRFALVHPLPARLTLLPPPGPSAATPCTPR